MREESRKVAAPYLGISRFAVAKTKTPRANCHLCYVLKKHKAKYFMSSSAVI